MNIKRTAINFTSSTLSAVALVGAIALVPAQAKANDDFIPGLIFGVILSSAMQNDHHRAEPRRHETGPVVVMPQHNPRNDRARPGYARGYDNPRLVCAQEVVRGRGHTEVISRNCYGEILSVTRTPRY